MTGKIITIKGYPYLKNKIVGFYPDSNDYYNFNKGLIASVVILQNIAIAECYKGVEYRIPST